VLVVGPESEETLTAYVNSHGVVPDGIFSLPTLRVNATPTILLVDRDGKLQKVWIGRLRSDG
jgi:hypothetical protein